MIELRADANPQIVLNNLFKHTAAQTTFPVNMVALVDGVPRTVNLQEALQAWLDHQVVVVTRRTQFRLDKAEARLHIVEGLLKALDMIDAIVKAIRASKDRGRGAHRADGQAASGSREIQANHILDMTLGRLTQLGREELATEKKELDATIKELQPHPRQARRAHGRDPRGARSRSATRTRRPRRTAIEADDTGTIDVGRAGRGRAVRRDRDRARVRARDARAGARPRRSRAPGERDAVAQVIETTALAGVLFFTDRGRAYRATVHDLPKERLTAAQNLFQFGDGERLVAVARRAGCTRSTRTSCS